ncbi:transmembrane protein 51a [Nothobranchius furzeri]|uniref:Transcript variant X1 n=5 Tax=Nothobranchius TaxID=28779 RepID=A0A8C6Q1B9_NOTFU|nr:transmembrane protein 51a [Nothobranchius furzeri]XP_015823056.1 transmembrane protein 51a [Nothobranchius furzeri]KAF7209555.1 transcript variant X2 [Nothobranchius furzeri]KAF7209556.1 transcript variant X1 [Nothobranchius furzeri]
MRSSENGPPCSPNGEGVNSNGGNNNSNNNMPRARSEIRGNSGSQYAVCALGVGLIALGVVMIVWSVVPSETSGNNSSSGSGGNSSIDSRRNKASSVAFVLAGSGVAMLLLSLCLGMRNKQREQLRLQELQNQREAAAREQEQRETTEEQARRYAVPTYEEAVGSGQYPLRQSNLRPSFSQLPSYDELVQVDGVQYENEGSDVTTQSSGAPDDPVSTTNNRPEKNSLKLLPIKLRRIKSEKLPEKSADVSQPTMDIGIEPLTPPPQYDDKVPPL